MRLQLWVRRVARASIFTLLLSAVSACALPQDALPSPPPTVLPTVLPSPTELPIEMLQPAACELHLWHSFRGRKEAALRALALRFEQENPHGIQVRVEFHEPLHAEVLAAIQAGTPPDIVISPCEYIAEYALLNAVVPLGSYLRNSRYGMSQEDQADLWPIALQGCSALQSQEARGLFFDVQAEIMFYNASWLKKLKAAGPPQNWEGFRKLCEAARDKKAGTWGYVHTSGGLALVNWVAGLGGALVDRRSAQATLDDEQAVAALSLLKDLLQTDCVYCTSEPGAARADFAAQRALLTFGSTADLGVYSEMILDAKTKKPRFEWGIAPTPYVVREPVVTVQGSTMSILRTSPSQQLAAWMFLRWFTSPENDLEWAVSTGALPLRKSTAQTDALAAYSQQYPQYQTACGLLEFAEPEPAIAKWGVVRILLAQAAESVCLGEAEPADALSAADDAADQVLSSRLTTR